MREDDRTRERASRLFPAASLLALVGLACGQGVPPLADCLPKQGLSPDCRFQAPEDLDRVGHWLVVSQMPTSTAPGSLVAFHPVSGRILPLYPERRPDSEPVAGDGAGDGGCAAGEPPPLEDFAPHGLDVSNARLLVVNHGPREAIEEFEIRAEGGDPALTWVSCTPLPADASANDVVALPDGGFAVTKMVERPQWLGIAKLLLGMNTGALLRYSPTSRTWETVPNSEGRAPNGVEVETDGTFFFSERAGRRIVRIEADGRDRQTLELDFSPDNLAWSSRGQLLVAGQRSGVLDVARCSTLEGGSCALASVVVQVDPGLMVPSPLVEDDPATVLGAASVAVELDGEFWIGAFSGDRLVKWKAFR